MRIIAALGLIVLTAVTWTGAPAKAEETGVGAEQELTGAWNGDAGRADDWGTVNLKSTENGYLGTYTATFNGSPGSVTFHKTATGKYKGLWWESDLKRYGSCELTVSPDGGTITLAWKALDDRAGAEKSGQSTWKRPRSK